VKHLQIAADPLDVDVQRVDGLEAGRQEQEGDERRNRQRDRRGGRDRGGGPEAEGDRQQDHSDGPAVPNRRPQRREFFVVMGHGVCCGRKLEPKIS
jgi:hypothetical protein